MQRSSARNMQHTEQMVNGIYTSNTQRVDNVEREQTIHDYGKSTFVDDREGILYNSDSITMPIAQNQQQFESKKVYVDNTNELNSFESENQISEQWPLTRYRLQHDPNPIVIKRANNESVLHYQQNVHIRYLKPPAPPTPGPLIIREVRPPQIAPAPSLIIRQRPVRQPTPPPLILREKPPKPPTVPCAQIITKKLAPLPPPPRQVIVERYPALPPKPRDVIIERWLPYDAVASRKVIYQRAAAQKLYAAKKNMIVHYEKPNVHYHRVFKRHGVIEVDPRTYVARYGRSLLSSSLLLENARRQGVHEDINIPIENQQQHATTISTTNTSALLNESEISKITGLEKNIFTHSYESLNYPRQNVSSSWVQYDQNNTNNNLIDEYNNPVDLYNDSEEKAYIDSILKSQKANRYTDSQYDSGVYADGTDISRSIYTTDVAYGTCGNEYSPQDNILNAPYGSTSYTYDDEQGNFYRDFYQSEEHTEMLRNDYELAQSDNSKLQNNSMKC